MRLPGHRQARAGAARRQACRSVSLPHSRRQEGFLKVFPQSLRALGFFSGVGQHMFLNG